MINIIVKANVIDIIQDIPKENDHFLIDTNVWYWWVYAKSTQCVHIPLHYQSIEYPNYINKALASHSEIHYSPFSLAELSHLIEKSEYEIFARSNPTQFPYPNKFDKNFRHSYPQVYKPEIIAACNQVLNLSSPLYIDINNIQINYFLSQISNTFLDGYDVYILNSMLTNNINNIITDDGDFTTVPDINVFTANANVINLAKSNGKLVTR